MADGILPTLLLNPTLGRVSLVDLVNGPRSALLAQYDAYGRSTQYNARRYDWDGRMLGYGEQADISPGWYVPLKHRQPAARLDLPKLINSRLSAFAVGSERWPEIKVAGDEAAEDFVKALAEACDMPAKILEARQKGGACGTAVVSFKFAGGLPRLLVHDARHMHILRWADRDELVVGAVLKAYSYQRTVYDEATGKPKTVTLYYARYWDETEERIWDPIPEYLARRGDWVTTVPSQAVAHNFGECPVHWCQNLPDSEQEDGQSDFEGLLDQFDRVNETLSATLKGTVANVDPTLVINDDPGANPGVIRKGSGTAIYSKGGAEYLELEGTAVESGLKVVDRIAQMCLDLAGVVVADPKDLASKAQSAAGLKILFQPQIAVCDVLRSQYGGLIRRLLLAMLRAARLVLASPAGPVVDTPAGPVQEKAALRLPSRFERVDGETVETKREPGTSENISLAWPPYFAATAEDVAADVNSAKTAKGVTISARTAVQFTARHFGVTDVDRELAEIEVERESEVNEMIRQAQDSAMPKPGALDDKE